MGFVNVKLFYLELFRKTIFKKYLYLSTIFFTIFFVLGYLFAGQDAKSAEMFFGVLSKKYLFALDYNFLQVFFFILKNNFYIAFIAYSSGIIFGLPTFFILFANAFVVGLVIKVASSDLSVASILLSILPHGVFEIPAILFSLSIGFVLGETLFRFIFKKKVFKTDFVFTLKIFLALVFPLLVISALVESILIIYLS